MGRLYRPSIPIAVKCEVAERQIMRASMTVSFIGVPEKPMHRRLRVLLEMLAVLKGCEVDELRLDHDPPLAARPKERRGLSRKTFYTPDANDPAHLFYRPHGPQHDGSHLIKTNVRGDHGQHPDRVLIKKQRLIERGPKPKRGRKIGSPGFYAKKTVQTSTLRKTAKPVPTSVSGADTRQAKRKWPTRRFEKRRKGCGVI